MAGDSPARHVTDVLRWGPRRGDPSGAVSGRDAAVQAGRIVASRVLPKFLAALSHHTNPALVDLGPVVGSNITFFGERLGCKIFVEDLYTEIERHAGRGNAAELPAFLDARFAGREASADGVLCWDVFDHLDRAAAQALARRVVQLVRPGGALFGCFGTAEVERHHYTKFVIVDETHLRHRPYPATHGRRRVMLNRDIIRLFEGLEVADSVLLQISIREILFRKS